METVTSSDSQAIIVEGGERVYPCRCGKTHRGDWAQEDFAHHNCLHEDSLMGLPVNAQWIQAICTLCGMSWGVKMEKV